MCLGLQLAVLELIATLNSPNRRYNLPPLAHLPLIHATCDITVAVIIFAQNPALLASSQK